MQLMDPIDSPRGREQVTNRFAWRIRHDNGSPGWAFVELRQGQIWVTGYPTYPVELLQPATGTSAGLAAGAGVGVLLGAAVGGPAGAVVGGILGALLGAAAGQQP